MALRLVNFVFNGPAKLNVTLHVKVKQFILQLPVCLSGFLADKFGNYTAAFLMAGGAGVAGSIIPFALLCAKPEQEQDINHDIEATIQHQGHEEHELQPRSSSEDSIFIIRNNHKRSLSFTKAVESPFY